MICNSCGKQIPDSIKFCIYCGSKVTTESVHAAMQQRFCRKCGSELEPDALFCDQCGCRIVPIPDIETEKKDALPGEVSITEMNKKQQSEVLISQPADQIQENVVVQPKYEALKKPEPSPAASQNSEKAEPPIDEKLGFIGLNEFIIDEKVTGMMFENSYVIYDMNQRAVGAVQQAKLSVGTKVFRGLTGTNTKNLQAFRLTLLDPNGRKLGAIYRNGSSFADIIVEDGDGRQILSSKLRFGGLKDNATGQVICKFSAWGVVNHKMMDDKGNVIAEINHKWNGAKSLFTTADKYHISISPELTGDMRRIICSIAVAFDIIAGVS